MNRLTRDQILDRALDMIDSPSLDQEDRPSGTFLSTALSVGWLQDALDLFHNRFPWAGIVKPVAVTLLNGNDTVALPADFILDVRDGVLITQEGKKRRLGRWPLQRFVTFSLHRDTPGDPERYVILPPNFRVWPKPRQDFSGTLWYYALPTTMGASDVPNFPSDWVLVEYVRLRGKEWINELPPGTALKYAEDRIRGLLASGLGHEPEDDYIPTDQDRFGARGGTRESWMGPSTVLP